MINKIKKYFMVKRTRDELMRLNNHELKDIGIYREDIWYISKR